MTRINTIHSNMQPAFANLPTLASILIVDDHRFDRQRLRRLSEKLEFDTHILEADCLETMGTRLEADTFDLIFLDYNLPDGTGLQAIKSIRLDPKNRNAAIIMITGDGQDAIAVEALKNGCSDYIAKDDLSPQAFERATVNALQKSSLYIGLETQEARRQKIEAVLQRFSSECAREIKPVVSRMMRQMRDLRDAPTISAENAAEMHQKMEKSCMRLWEFLEELDHYEGTDIAQDVVPAASLDASPVTPRRATAAAPKTKAPPKRSLFNRDAPPPQT